MVASPCYNRLVVRQIVITGNGRQAAKTFDNQETENGRKRSEFNTACQQCSPYTA